MAFCFLASSNLLRSGSLHFLPHQRNSEMIWWFTNQEQNRKSWNLNTFHFPTDPEVSQWLCCALGGPSLHWGRVMKPLRYLGIDRRFQRRLHVKPFPAIQNRWLAVTSFPVTPDIIIWIKFTSCLRFFEYIHSMRGSPLKTHLLFLHVLSCIISGLWLSLTNPMKLWDSPLQFSKQMWCRGIVPLSIWQGWEWECFSPKGVLPSRPFGLVLLQPTTQTTGRHTHSPSRCAWKSQERYAIGELFFDGSTWKMLKYKHTVWLSWLISCLQLLWEHPSCIEKPNCSVQLAQNIQ